MQYAVPQYATARSPTSQIRDDNNMLMEIPLNTMKTQLSDDIQYTAPSTPRYTTLQNYESISSRENSENQIQPEKRINITDYLVFKQ